MLLARFRRAFALVLGTLLVLSSASRAADPLARPEMDRRVVESLRETIDLGATIFNNGNQEGCYRLYQGTLMTLSPLLDHRPGLQKLIAQQLQKTQAMRNVSDRAFALRTAIDEVRSTIGKDLPATAGRKSLWERLGGEPAVRAVVHDFVVAAAPDPKVNFDRGGTFALTPDAVKVLEQRLVELVSAVGGGPLKYTGRDMKSAHQGMAITDAEFDALAGHLIAVLKKYNVPKQEMDELVGAIAGTRKEIVEGKAKPVAKKSLYERLGGEPAVTAVVDEFVARAASNPKVNFTRKGTGQEWEATPENVKLLKKQLIALIGAVTGGPQKYEGRSMKAAHKGMQITGAEFDALAGDLKATLDKFKVPAQEQGELFKIIGSTKDDIVERK